MLNVLARLFCPPPSPPAALGATVSSRIYRYCKVQTAILRLPYLHWRRQGGGQGAQPPSGRARFFFVNIEGLLESVVLNLSFRVRSNAMFTSERRY